MLQSTRGCGKYPLVAPRILFSIHIHPCATSIRGSHENLSDTSSQAQGSLPLRLLGSRSQVLAIHLLGITAHWLSRPRHVGHVVGLPSLRQSQPKQDKRANAETVLRRPSSPPGSPVREFGEFASRTGSAHNLVQYRWSGQIDPKDPTKRLDWEGCTHTSCPQVLSRSVSPAAAALVALS